MARIKYGLQKAIKLGNLKAKRDWGYAGDYVKAMWLMLQNDVPEDFVIATGTTHTVADFAKAAFDSIGYNWKDYVEVDPQLFRPTEVDFLIGDYSKAKNVLGWEPETTFEKMVSMMIEKDLKQVLKDVLR